MRDDGSDAEAAGSAPEAMPVVPAAAPLATVQAQADESRCKNCRALLAGRYCASCGQRADVHMPTTRELLHDALEGVTHSDSRLWRTLLLLWFRPGELTQEFLAGRRASSLPPFRLYIIISIVFFLLVASNQSPDLSFGAPAETTSPAEGHSKLCDDMRIKTGYAALDQRIKRACTEIRRDNAKTLKRNLIAALPKAMFLFLPLIAFLHMLLYWRPRHRYAVHLLFFVQLQAFFFSVGIVLMLLWDMSDHWPRFAGTAGVLKALLGWSLPVYTVLALHRVFRNGWPLTLLKALALAVGYFLLAVLMWLGVFVYAALEL